MVIQRLSPKSELNTEYRLATLARYDDNLDEQALISGEMEVLYNEIKGARFAVYQMYYINELRERVDELFRPNTFSEKYTYRGAEILKLLLFVRQELRSREKNLIQIGEKLVNCREGKANLKN